MKVLTQNEVAVGTLRDLGLGRDLTNLLTREAVACALRRVAGMYCPTSRGALRRAVIEPLRGLVDNPDLLSELVEEVLEAVIAHGDLLELPEVASTAERPRTLVYSAPPMFLVRSSGAVLLLGIAGEEASLLPGRVERRLEHRGHVRVLPADAASEVVPHLESLGFTELSERAWLEPPARVAPEDFVERFDRALQQEPDAGQIEELRIIDPGSEASYYRGRWTEAGSVSGNVVGRRPQRFGADLWCYVTLEKGQPERFLDLPVGKTRYRACDEAWRLQAAIDALGGKPQRLRIRPGPFRRWTVDVFSPLPMWLARRWDAVGDRTERSPGALLSYTFGSEDTDEETKFACEMMWLALDRAT